MQISDMEKKRFGGVNPKPSGEMMASGQMQEMEMLQSAEQADEDMFSQLAPRGQFSQKSLNALVKATNRLLPLFGQEPTYPEFSEDLQQLPTEFVRVLAMFQGAINAAVDAEYIPEDMDFLLEQIVDDSSLQLLAGKITQMAGDRNFKQFLKDPPMEEEDEEEEMSQMQMEENNMTEAAMDEMFLSRV